MNDEKESDFVVNGLFILCDKCTKPLSEQGVLIFTLPDRSHHVKKYHLCVSCFEKFKETEISRVRSQREIQS